MARRLRTAPDRITCKHCGKDFRAITFRHLHNIHDYDDDHPIVEYKRRFYLRTALCAEARKKISAAKKDYWARRGQGWTRARILSEIRRLHRTGRSLRPRDIPVRLELAGRRHFKSWQAAVEKAGWDYEKVTGIHHWTTAKVIEAIRELADRGEPLHATHVEQHHYYLYKAAIGHFPRSWAKALRAAGFDPREHIKARGIWNRDKAASWVRKRVTAGRSILARDVRRDLCNFVWSRCGQGWTDFVESLGIPYPGIKKRRDWSREKVVAEIRRLKREGHPLNYRAVKLTYQALIHQAKKFFKTWDAACAAANVLASRKTDRRPHNAPVPRRS